MSTFMQVVLYAANAFALVFFAWLISERWRMYRNSKSFYVDTWEL